MLELLRRIFSSEFMPHGMCYLWNPGVLWLNVASDALIALSYYAIPFLLISFVRKRRDLEFQGIFVAFAFFILSCGSTHLLAVWTVWHGTYWLDGSVKAITAISSAATAILLAPLVPKLVALPSPRQLARVNRTLADEIGQRIAAQEEVQQVNSGLERRIAERTAELQASNEQLRESIERYRFLADSMPQIVWTARPDGWLDYYNRQWYDYTGLTPVESQGWNWERVLHPDDLQNCIAQWSRAVETGETYQAEYRLRHAGDGAYRWHLGRGVPRRNDQGEIVQWVGTSTDIDDLKRAKEAAEQANRDLLQEIELRRKLEEQLVQSQKMEAIGRLAGGIAHDFNNLLTGILGFAGMLLDDVVDRATWREHVAQIQAAAQRAASLTQQLLAFSRRQPAQPRIVNLNSLVADMEKLLRRVIGEDIALITDLAPDLQRASIDPGQVDQIIMNLAVNARDAMPQGGSLTIQTRNTELEPGSGTQIGVAPGRYVMLAVTDTGSGMDAQTRMRIFEPFFSTKEQGRGTGLGLSIVYGIVKQNSGDIWVYSEPGHGTTFKIYLPVAAGEVREHAMAGVRARESRGETVLLVEDEDVVRRFAAAILRQEGYAVIETATAEEALAAAAGHSGPIDLLLTDVVMPGMSGPELARALHGGGKQMRVVFMSGYPRGHAGGQGLLPPGAAYLQKPFTADTLRSRLREVLEA